jgi:murein DD-endopeptidase MepM/ murein hydrolase activator NlpD
VVAPADGVITLAVPDMFYSGGTVIIDHGYGVSSTFLHLSKLYLNVGDKVKQGDKVAEIGATGRVTGPHLDWRLNWFQMRLDPVSIVPPMASVLAEQQSQKR